jgi:exodeoxyribonuclease V alpha subunit
MDGAPGTSFEAEVTIRRRRFANPDTGFAVVDARRGQDDVVLVGPLSHLEERERARVSGTWTEDARFGMQVKVALAEPLAPAGEQAVLSYLKRVRHVGESRAVRLLVRHPGDTLAAIDQDPRKAFRAVGLKGRQAEEATRSWNGLRGARQLHLALAPHGLAYLVPRLQEHYGADAHRLVRERPYELTSVFGVGFAIADRIARGNGLAPEDPQRRRAALVHVLVEAERDGSTCLPAVEAARRAAEVTGGEPPEAALIAGLVEDGILTVEDGHLFRAPTARLEAEVADRVRRLAEAAPSGRLAPPDEQLAGEASDEQHAAVHAAFGHRLSIVTGGPGTGKTATIRLICAHAEALKRKVLLVAPTGRAARRMAEATDLDACTVHAALGWIPGEGPTHDEQDPLDPDVLVCDESSMANLELLVALLRAVGSRTHLVLVGDADQLAPVGAGQPFADLVVSDRVPVTRLTRIFRQAAGSLIVRGAHAVREGRAPDFQAPEGVDRDLFLIERADAGQALDEIVSLVAERLPRHYEIDPVEDVQVFAPVYRGPLGIDALNQRLRAALNPDGSPVLGGRFRIGDKLMLAGRNLHELGLMNGTVLRLLDHGDDALTVSADGMTIRLPEEEAPRLQLAYACSVHKGQGIELPVALVVAHPAAGARFLRREMLYTAMTRARRATIIVGRRDVVARAAATPDAGRRCGRLTARLAA